MFVPSNHSKPCLAFPRFIASCLLNMGWILVWHDLYVGLSVAVMLVMLGVQTTLFRIVHREYITSWPERLFIALPFTIYLAWICVATIADVSAWLVALGWQGGFLSQQSWTIIMMTVAAILACKISIDYRTPAFAVVVVWALLGIAVRWWDGARPVIVTSALLGIAALISVLIFVVRRRVRA